MPSRVLPGLGLRGFWPDGEHGWGTMHSEDIRKVSALLQGRCLSITNTLPGSPTDGDIHICGDTEPTNPDKIAIRDNGAWVYITPAAGWEMYDIATSKRYRYSGTTWVDMTVTIPAPPKYIVGGFFNSPPVASEVIMRHIFSETVTFADEFAGSVGHVGTNPASSFAMDVKKNGASVGSITIATGGAFTFVTTGTTVAFASGDRIELVAPATPDASIANLSVSLVGTR